MEKGKHLSSTDGRPVDFDTLGRRIRSALEPVRTHALSLHDERGDLLWLSESSMGPDEHNAVREAFETFAAGGAGPTVLVYDLGDARSAVLFRATSTKRQMIGAVMAIVDSRAIKQDTRGAAVLITQKLQRALADFAAALRPGEPEPQAAAAIPAAAPARAPKPAPAAPASRAAPATSTARAAPAAHAASSARAAPVARAVASAPLARAPPSAPAARDASSARQGAPAAPRRPATEAVTPEVDRLHAALRLTPIALHVQRLVPLSKGSRLQRYEVLLRAKSDSPANEAPHAMLKAAIENGLGSMIDRRVVTELVGWLVRHHEAWHDYGVMFSVNLTRTALHDEHFMKFVELCLNKASLPKGIIAFEVDVPTAIKPSSNIADVAAALHRLGCPLVLDDFGLRTECFTLLRLPGVRYIKMAPDITAQIRTDKVSQASITALVQMARVLGMHTVAKRMETPAEEQWLTALGVDFVQSYALSPPMPIESLEKPGSSPASAS